MKAYFTLILVLIGTASVSAKRIGIDTTLLLGEELWIYNIRSMEVADNGDKYIMGFYKGQMSIGNTTVTSNINPSYSQNYGLFISKYNANEEFLWLKKIGECDTFINYTHCLDSHGNILLGLTIRADLELRSDTVLGMGLTDAVILKLDTAGNEIYHKVIQTSCYETIDAVISDELNNIYMSGGYGTDFNGDKQNCHTDFGNTVLQDSLKTTYLAKYDSSGNELWVKTYGSEHGAPMAYLAYSNNRLYAVGACGSIFNNDFHGLTLTFPQNYLVNGFIVQLDTAGNGKWGKTYGPNHPNLLSGFKLNGITAQSNRVAFTATDQGNIQNVFQFEGGSTLTAPNTRDYIIAAYDTLGNFKWNKISKSLGSEIMSSLQMDRIGNLYGTATHTFKINFPSDTLPGRGAEDIHIVSYDSSGTYRFAFEAGGAGADIGSDIKLNAQGKIYIVGGTTSNPCYMGNDTLYPLLNQSTLFYARIDSIANLNTNVSLYELSSNEWSVYPNPAEDIVYVQVADSKLNTVKELVVYDMVGREVRKKRIKNPATNLIPISVIDLTEGIYILSIKTDARISSKKIIKR